MGEILLVTQRKDCYWAEILAEAASRFDLSVAVIGEGDLDEASLPSYRLLIIDSAAVDNLVAAIESIHSCAPLLGVIVVSSAPHWREATEALLAGAVDYVRREDSVARISDLLCDSLARSPSMWSRPQLPRR